MEVVVTEHNFESILPKDHPFHVCFKLADWFQKRRLKMAAMSRHSFNIEPYGSMGFE
jgi:hypothetical protein